MARNWSDFQAVNISFLIIFLYGVKNAGLQHGTKKWKYKKCNFFDFVLKVIVCFNLEKFEIFGKHLEHILKSNKQ